LGKSLLSQYQAHPQFGHLEAVCHIFPYQKKHLDMARLAYDSRRPDINKKVFHHNADWTEFYGNVKEELLPNMPKLWGHPVTISAFVDAGHAVTL
jgi:hypothetical protein